MVNLGDILAVVATLVGVYLTGWALVMGCGLLFEAKTEAAMVRLEENGGRCIGVGALIALTLGMLSVIMMGIPAPGIKLLGMLLMLALLAMATLGMAGIGRLVAERIQRLAPETNLFSGFSRGSAIVVAGSLVPVLGWFGFGPIALMASLGAGWSALRSPRGHMEAIP